MVLHQLLRATNAGLRWMGGATSAEYTCLSLLEAEGYSTGVIDRNPNSLYTIVGRPRTS